MVLKRIRKLRSKDRSTGRSASANQGTFRLTAAAVEAAPGGSSAKKYEKTFQVSTCLLLLAGFLALVVAEGLHPIWIAVAVPILLLSQVVRPRPVGTAGQLALLGLITFVAAVDMLLLSSPLEVAVHFLLLSGLFKLFTRRSGRDYLILFLVSFSFMLVASSYTISVIFLAALVGYVLVAIFTLILFESRDSYQRNRNAEFSLGVTLLLATAITLLIVLVAAPIFIVIPRTSLAFFKPDVAQAQRLSGFSDRVNLGDIGRIITNSSPVMRVTIDPPVDTIPLSLKWRGIALDHYDGRSWRNTSRNHAQIPWSPQFQGFLVPAQRRSDALEITQQIDLAVASRIVFAARDAVMIRGAARSGYFRDGNSTLYRLPDHPSSYTVYSDYVSRPQRLSAAQDAPAPPRLLRRYLQLPTLRPEIEALAVRVSASEPSLLGKALLLEHHLKDSFGYSLENLPALGDDPLYDFLFETREGHCEYFATAQAVMMRSLGIPARVINGFRLGEYNPFNGLFFVRQSDAHSWVEGYFPGAGWIEFDPTPAAGSPPSQLSRLAVQFLDALDLFWSEIVTFDQMKQIGLFRSMAIELHKTWWKLRDLPSRLSQGEWPSSWSDFISWDLLPVLLGLGVLLAALLYLGFRFRFRLLSLARSAFGSRKQESAPPYYLEMLGILAGRGLEKDPAETPAEFARRVESSLETSWVSRVTSLYYGDRFGRRDLTDSQLREIETGLAELRA